MKVGNNNTVAERITETDQMQSRPLPRTIENFIYCLTPQEFVNSLAQRLLLTSIQNGHIHAAAHAREQSRKAIADNRRFTDVYASKSRTALSISF
jgi:hypothetical protein